MYAFGHRTIVFQHSKLRLNILNYQGVVAGAWSNSKTNLKLIILIATKLYSPGYNSF